MQAIRTIKPTDDELEKDLPVVKTREAEVYLRYEPENGAVVFSIALEGSDEFADLYFDIADLLKILGEEIAEAEDYIYEQ